MKVIFLSPQKLGGKSYSKGTHIIPDALAYNLGFKQMVKGGSIQMVPRDVNEQKVQMSKDLKAMVKAKAARKAKSKG